MRPKERRESGQTDLLRSRLDQILNMDHGLVKLAGLARVYDDDPGRPPLPTRLMAGLAILKSMHNCPTKCCASAGLRTPITSCCAARSSSSTVCPSTAAR